MCDPGGPAEWGHLENQRLGPHEQQQKGHLGLCFPGHLKAMEQQHTTHRSPLKDFSPLIFLLKKELQTCTVSWLYLKYQYSLAIV